MSGCRMSPGRAVCTLGMYFVGCDKRFTRSIHVHLLQRDPRIRYLVTMRAMGSNASMHGLEVNRVSWMYDTIYICVGRLANCARADAWNLVCARVPFLVNVTPHMLIRPFDPG